MNAVPTPTPGSDARGFCFALETDAQGLLLRAAHHPDYGPIRADWIGAETRRRIQAGKRQLLARAIGLHKRDNLSVLDATAGLGRDGYTLAALGASVTLVERHPLLLPLLEDARQRALADTQAAAAAMRTEILAGEAAAVLASGRRWDVVHLDPMYPHTSKQALPQKEMQILRELTDGDPDAAALLAPARAFAKLRVVVKRPRTAPFLDGAAPSFQLVGSQARYDVYLPSPA